MPRASQSTLYSGTMTTNTKLNITTAATTSLAAVSTVGLLLMRSMACPVPFPCLPYECACAGSIFGGTSKVW